MSDRKPILVCVTGLSPQIVTETLQCLIERDPPFLPAEVHLISTATGKRLVKDHLEGNDGQVARLYRDYLPNQSLPEIITHLVEDNEGEPLDDIQTPEHNEALADTVMDVVRNLTVDEEGTVVHASVAGGRKTMGVYMANAMTYLARPQDEMSHVLVNPPFESSWDFFFKPKEAINVVDQHGHKHSTDKAELSLAVIPFVRLGASRARTSKLNTLTSRHSTTSYSDLVGSLRSEESTRKIDIDVEDREIFCGGQLIKGNSMISFVFYLWLAERAKEGKAPVIPNTDFDQIAVELIDVIDRSFLNTDGRLKNFLTDMQKIRDGDEGATFDRRSEYMNRLENMLQSSLGGVADLYLPKRTGKPQKWLLDIPAENIHIKWPC